MRSLILNRKNWQPTWRFGICVLLICMVVYNPFVGATTVSSHLSYAQMARNRATIGSSELRKFSPAPETTVQPELDAASPDPEPVVADQEIQPGVVQCETIPWQPELCASLWFRPPPTQ